MHSRFRPTAARRADERRRTRHEVRHARRNGEADARVAGIEPARSGVQKAADQMRNQVLPKERRVRFVEVRFMRTPSGSGSAVIHVLPEKAGLANGIVIPG